MTMNALLRRVAIAAICASLVAGSAVARQTAPAPARVIVLGVTHSGQLVAERQQPAALRAFMNRVKPDAIAIERSPEELARNDFYEFTYEQQYLAVPYARERNIPLYAIDWLPDPDETLLAFGIADLEKPPFLRAASGFQSFVNFPDADDLRLDLFFGESPAAREPTRTWASTPAANARGDYARRLFLYRTFMQAMRVARAARNHPGGTVLVLVGSMHEEDMENILANDPAIALVPASSVGLPEAKEIDALVTREDALAVASFNLLGTQAATGNVDWAWVERMLGVAEKGGRTSEVELLRARFEVLRARLAPRDAIARYERIAAAAGEGEPFTWTGVKDRSRIDSFFDPFGNLTVKQRARLEIARERARLGDEAAANEVRRQLTTELSPLKSAQLAGYWDEFLLKAR